MVSNNNGRFFLKSFNKGFFVLAFVIKLCPLLSSFFFILLESRAAALGYSAASQSFFYPLQNRGPFYQRVIPAQPAKRPAAPAWRP